MDNNIYYTNRLQSLTPELSAEERSAMFGTRSTNDKARLCLWLLDTNQTQRESIYSVLREWMRQLAKLN